MTEKYLFIGGFDDGKRIDLPKNLQEITRCTMKKLTFGQPKTEENTIKQVYKKQTISSGNRDFHIFVYSKLWPENIFELLLKNYRPTQ